MAGRPGFEPGLMESESIVLPLDDLPVLLGSAINHQLPAINKQIPWMGKGERGIIGPKYLPLT